MKKLKFSLLFALLVAFLAACGSDDGGNGATLGSLLVTVNGPESATVSVTGPNTSSQTVAGSTTFADLTPGSYTVSGAADGYETTNETVVIVGGQQAAVSLSLPKIAQPAVSSVSLSPSSLALEVGEVGSLQATVSGNEDLSRDDMGVTYQSSNTDVATVNREGIVTGFAEGTAVITATSDFDPSYFDTSRVNVAFDSSNQNQTDGVLAVSVSGNEGRSIEFTITGPAGFSETVSTSARTTLTVPAGAYTVTAPGEVEVDASLSYVVSGTPQQTATVTAGQLSEAAFAYTRVNPNAETNIANFRFVSAVDAQGAPYDTQLEDNTQKVVTLSASQTEEVFCVTFVAEDAAGDPVPNASVGIDVTGAFVGNANVTFDWDDVVTVVPVPSGSCANLSLNTTNPNPNTLATQQEAVDSTLSTNAEGEVTFALFATDGIRPNPFVDTGFDGFTEEPAKIVLTASNANTTLVDELKVWFINITHLTYYSVDPRFGADTFVNSPFRVADANFGNNHLPSLIGGTQVQEITLDDGTTVDAFVSAFDTEDPTQNVHTFDTYFYQKQPEVPNRTATVEGFDPNMELGFMRYDIIRGGADFDLNCLPDNINDLTSTDPQNVTVLGEDSCFDNDGVAQVVPTTINAEDFPIDVCVEATYFARASFRGSTDDYSFALKSYTFCKTFRQEFLSLIKFADNHVLSWAGADDAIAPVRPGPNGTIEGFQDTLGAFNQPSSSEDPFTSTYRIIVTNPSSGPIRNLVISDDLPAELGVVLDAIQPSGDFPTYDADNHTLTWDYRDPALAPLLDELGPGEYLEFSYEVYARQKPGVQWTAPVLDSPRNSIFGRPGFNQGWIDYVRAPMYPNYEVERAGQVVQVGNAYAPNPQFAYPDPYCITNGDDFANEFSSIGNDNDVTVEFDFSVTGGTRQVIDYDPIADESDICVVRPLFNITKRRVTDHEINRGETVVYELIARQVDRVNINAPARPLPANEDTPDGRESAAAEREYAWLAELYPWEFGIDADGLGHRADEDWYKQELPELLGVTDMAPTLPEELVNAQGDPIRLTDDIVAPNVNELAAPRRSDETFKLRDNPIGSNVTVLDIFDVGLDYVSDNDLMIINVGNSDRFHTILDPDYASVIGSEEGIRGTINDEPNPRRGSGIRATANENPDANPIADKRFVFEEVDQFLPDDVGVSTITLRAGLASAADDEDGVHPPINASAVGNRVSYFLDDWDNEFVDVDGVQTATGVTRTVDNPFNDGNPAQVEINVDGIWMNCAYLDADNMNQPTPILQVTDGPFAAGSYGASWYNGQAGPNVPEVAYIDAGFFFGRPLGAPAPIARPNVAPYTFIDDYDPTAGINDYPWDRNDMSNAVGEFLSAAEVAELAARGNPLSYATTYNPGNLPISYDNPVDFVGIGEWNNNPADVPAGLPGSDTYLVGSVNGALAITRPAQGLGVENFNIVAPHANDVDGDGLGERLAGRNKDEVSPNNPPMDIIDSVTGRIRSTGALQSGIEACAGVRAIQDVPPPPVGNIEFTPRGETFEGGTNGANLVAVQALVEVDEQYYYQIDFLNAGTATIENIVFTALWEDTEFGLNDPLRFRGRGNARYVANDENNTTAATGDDPPSQIFEGRISPQFPLDVPQVRPFRLLGAADVVDDGGVDGPAGQAFGNEGFVPPSTGQVPAGVPANFLNRVVFNNDGDGYDLRTGRVLRLMVKAEGIDVGSEQALFVAYFDVDTNDDGNVDSRDFREIRDETDIANPR